MSMSTDQKPQEQQATPQNPDDKQARQQEAAQALNDVDGLADKKPEDLTPEELRLMADTMPGEGPGD
jgi:hypothetical protein